MAEASGRPQEGPGFPRRGATMAVPVPHAAAPARRGTCPSPPATPPCPPRQPPRLPRLASLGPGVHILSRALPLWLPDAPPAGISLGATPLEAPSPDSALPPQVTAPAAPQSTLPLSLHVRPTGLRTAAMAPLGFDPKFLSVPKL